ncbi:hypothetical protein FGG78_30815 [Thioclava sp. BHET1]|nr:hypothetical protein FGG78_30815 [Thioclava sp. BHET1]
MRNNPTLMRLIYGSIAYAVDRGSVERLIIIDEAAVLGRMSVFEQIRDEMRKKGARLMLIYQSLGQMVHAYGREGMRAWNNGVAVRCFSGIEDEQELRELSELIGNYTVEVDGESRAVQKRPGFLASQSQSQTNSTSLQSARLITTDQIKDLPLDAQIVFFKGQRPLLCGKAFWFRRPEWQLKPAKQSAA